jgi:hypothetical protein
MIRIRSESYLASSPSHEPLHITCALVSGLMNFVLRLRWFKVKLKVSPTSTEPPQSGLVPANYVVPAQALHLVTALYAYGAQTEEELVSQPCSLHF